MNYPRLDLIEEFALAALKTEVYRGPAPKEIRVVIREFADAAAEDDCADSLQALLDTMRVAERQNATLCILDLSQLKFLEKTGCKILSRGCTNLRDRGTRLLLIRPEQCELAGDVAAEFEELAQLCSPVSLEPRTTGARVLGTLGLKVTVAVLFYFMSISLVFGLMTRPVPPEARYAMDAVLAVGGALLTTTLGGDVDKGYVEVPLPRGLVVRLNLTGPTAVFLSVFLAARFLH
jgi:hypothetical protein